MPTPQSSPLSFWKTVRLLLSVARRRAIGRGKRQLSLLNQRTEKNSSLDTWGWLGFVAMTLAMALLHAGAAFIIGGAVNTGQQLEVEKHGKIVVGQQLTMALQFADSLPPGEQELARQLLEKGYAQEARRRSRRYGGPAETHERLLRDAVASNRSGDFVDITTATPGIKTLATSGAMPALLGSLLLGLWFVMMVCQGEGLELDVQRRRHPMWEWLFSHPVSAPAIFTAEILAPIAANPIYCGAPVFFGFLYGSIYGAWPGVAAGVLIGVPLTVATASFGKALEIGLLLRCSPRSRGAVIGLIGWLGYVAMMLLMMLPLMLNSIGAYFWPLTIIPWPWLSWMIGARADGSFSLLAGMLVCWGVALGMMTCGVGFSVWGVQRGLISTGGSVTLVPVVSSTGLLARFGSDPLYRKELLWFLRDRSALVQVILIPATMLGVQLFQFRGLSHMAPSAWNYLAGAAIILGAYFLLILGPKSLVSEGPALWLALTWPRGLENLLLAKARLWFLLASSVVALVLGYAALSFPEDAWKVGLVGLGWVIFGRSMAAKSVTLVSAPSSSGEPEPLPPGRRWATTLGMFTFGIGILSGQWQIAIMGIVYSWMTAAAMWQNFRARLPYLYDPWSEKLPPPPTLMHAMIAISALGEGVSVITGIAIAIVGRDHLGATAAAMYGLGATIVSIIMMKFLRDRDVGLKDVWYWREPTPADAPLSDEHNDVQEGSGRTTIAIGMGLIGGVVLGIFAKGYLALILTIPSVAEMMRTSQETMSNIPNIRMWYGLMAVAFAPLAEEYLFRGLLFRALDREWGGRWAVLGSAVFFAVYHPALSWIPVGLLGVACALLFRKTRRLVSAVVMHVTYNAIVVLS
ncbi:MAG: CPBP family intramembrane metalloprotease [Deltaproteobacteria bacterium]|nr:CPBP family intramembrane metalloprotease [Deltaproteobacteria bacterium]